MIALYKDPKSERLFKVNKSTPNQSTSSESRTIKASISTLRQSKVAMTTTAAAAAAITTATAAATAAAATTTTTTTTTTLKPLDSSQLKVFSQLPTLETETLEVEINFDS